MYIQNVSSLNFIYSVDYTHLQNHLIFYERIHP
nr:MAG TPA: hypothetical protein [Caudoviricetes sp.]